VTFGAQVELAATAIERRASDATVRRNARLWKLGAIPEMRQACFRPEAIGALVDAWTFVRQMDQLFREGSARNAFGPFRLEALEVSGRLVAQMREITASVAVSPEAQVELEHQIIDPWIVEHPLRDITFVRESPIARFAEQSAARGDALQAVGSMEEIVNSLSQQARIYVADLPRQVRGEIDLLWSDVLPPELLSSMQGDLHTASAAADSIAATAEKVSGLLTQERQAVLDEVSRQRALVLAAIDVERQEAVGAMTSAFTLERGQLLREIDAQRRDTLAWATAERQETILDVRRELDGAIGALRGERATAVTEIRHLVDLVLLRLALGIIAAVVLAPLVAHAYVRVWPRR
jgi:hypothetical protein